METPQEHTMTTITVTCDMKSDLHYAGLLNDYVDRIESAETVEAEQQAVRERDEIVAEAAWQWKAAAERIGAEWGYEVTAVTTQDGRMTTTYDGDPDQADQTVEQQLWQTAHDAVDVLR